MQPLNPLDDTLAYTLNALKQDIDALQRARQPYYGDWIEIGVSSLSYSANNILNTAISYVSILNVGDKVKISQGGSDKYFFIYKVTSTQIYVNGGTDYTFTNSAFTTFAFSRASNPLGHPSSSQLHR